jgi:hypothetical protein
MSEPSIAKPAAPTKSFMTAGPTLHYSHANVHGCWLLSIVVYAGICLFWARLTNGQFLVLNLLELFYPSQWHLGRVVTEPLSIYEYPWQIAILGTLMGLLAVTPLLTAQLMSFRYSVPLVLLLMFLARLPLLGVFELLSCIAVACRPLRFRSRVVSLALCLAGPMIYWAFFGGISSSDPIRWGISFTPWIYSWLIAMLIAGVVIAIGHYNRYRPGLIGLITLMAAGITYLTFEKTIGFDELDYQMYVAGNNPEKQVEFHDHVLTRYLDRILADEMRYSYFAGYFYPSDKIDLRKKLREEIESLLYYNRWPQWFLTDIPEELRYQSKKSQLLAQYNYFLEKRPFSRRVPIALYFKAMVNELTPDARYFGQTEILRFYNDYPFYENLHIWQDLLVRFPDSPEALEARWRAAVHTAGQGRFKEATELCNVDLALVSKTTASLSEPPVSPGGLLTAFAPPAKTVMTRYKLQDLRSRLLILKETISPANQGSSEAEKQRLARFVLLNPYGFHYPFQLEELLASMPADDPLRDNVLTARARLIQDLQVRSAALREIWEKYPEQDGGIQALYELGAIRLQQWKESKQGEAKGELLAEARSLLNRVIQNYPQSPFAELAGRLLAPLANLD